MGFGCSDSSTPFHDPSRIGCPRDPNLSGWNVVCAHAHDCRMDVKVQDGLTFAYL